MRVDPQDSASGDRVADGGWYALIVMLLIFSCHFLDRSVLSLVAEPVRREFALSDSQLGLLTGFVFGLMYAIAGVPIGLLVDRVNRQRLLASMVFLWSSATAACGLAPNFLALLAGRMAVGAAEAGGAPTSLSLVSDFFPARLRSTAIGIYYMGGAVGGLMIYLVGSRVAAYYGWRSALLVAAIPGVVLALIALLTLREPKRGGAEANIGCTPTGPVSLTAAYREMASNRSLLYLFAAAPLTSASASAAGAWLAPFFMRIHGLPIGSAGLILAIAAGGFGAVGSTFGGLLADRLAQKELMSRTAFGGWVMLLAIPALLGSTLVVKTAPAIIFTFASFALIFSALPVCFGGMLTLTPPRIRGVTSATMQGICNLLGYGLGSLGVGVLSDAIGGTSSLRYALAIVSTVCCFGSAFFLFAARAAMRSGAGFERDLAAQYRN